jgi:hypothetical protein
MEQTAVEFLVELLNNLNDDFNLAFKDEIKQAKEMEKQQQGYSEEDLDMFRKFMIQEQNFSKSCLDVFIEQFKNK